MPHPIAEIVKKLLEPGPRNISFEYSELKHSDESSAILKTIGKPMPCPHCGMKVAANTGHACKRVGKKWTAVDTPL